MIHVCTIHYNTPEWIQIQDRFLQEHLDEFTTWVDLGGVSEEWDQWFDHVTRTNLRHGPKLNNLAQMVCEAADQDDWIMFLDGDAFPVTNPLPTVEANRVSGSALTAVQRLEALGGQQPHPCFTMITVKDWIRLNGDWRPGYRWEDANGKKITDVGGNLLGILEKGGHQWTKLHRMNTVNPHPTMFAVYGDTEPLVYHHGAGFRVPSFRIDTQVGAKVSTNKRMSSEVRSKMFQDLEFWKEFTQ